jgi:O-antigen/teichoic acid export membrane protein
MLFYTRFNFLSINLYALGVFGKTVMYDVIGGILRLILIFSLISYLGFIALPIAEFLSTTFLIGYFLNKLIISKIELKGKEILNFVFSGSSLLVVVFSMSFVFIYFLPPINSWILFVEYAILIACINSVVILVFSKPIRLLVFNFMRHLKIIKAKDVEL